MTIRELIKRDIGVKIEGVVKVFDRTVAASTPDNEQISRRSELLEEACERVHFVVIQREALQLSCLDGFFEDYEITDEVRARMGPKRRK